MFDFDRKKQSALAKYQRALAEGAVDELAKPLVVLINQFPNYYTTSSCVGRFVLLSKLSFRNKYSAAFVYKTHDLPVEKEVLNHATSPFEGQLWLNVEPPTFHVGTRTVQEASDLLKIALDAQMGYSMIKTVARSIVVEVRGTGLLQMPIGQDGELLIADNHLRYTVDLAREIMTDERERLDRWRRSLEDRLDV